MNWYLIGGISGGIFVFLSIVLALMYRTVVSTNDVHIVQSNKTVSYGAGQKAGNVYYAWPAWMPLIGIKIIRLPVSVFDLHLESYAAYDKGRVPFQIDIMAFFRIDDSNVAAQRVHSFDEMKEQLVGILQGASRSILAKEEINEILEERAKYGLAFTDATNDQLKAWGVVNVKNIELMDIRDAGDSKAIANIMAKKQSHIAMESRVEVAKNMQAAKQAEIDAGREVSLREQEAEQQVGQRTAEKDKQVGIAKQQAEQEVKTQEKVTAEKRMEVVKVQEVRKAEIERDVQIVNAEQGKRTAIISAEGEKQKTITEAEGKLEQAKMNATGVEVEGRAKGEAERAVLMAPVTTQIELAKEIGTNPGYQTYLIAIRTVEKDQAVGMEQAKALAEADIKVIANTGDAISGVKNVMELLSSKGGTQIGAMVEAIAQTPAGEALMKKLNGSGESAAH